MIDESIHKNPQDIVGEIFVRLEYQVTNISHNMSLIMPDLARNIKKFREARGSNFEIRSEGKLRDNQDLEKELRKDPKKEKPGSSVVNPSQSLFNMEDKVDIYSYQGDINALKLSLVATNRSLFHHLPYI